MKIGIRRENKNIWERRVPIIPQHVRELAGKCNIEFLVQPSPIRVFKEEEYRTAGADIAEDLSKSDVVFAVKEIPADFFRPSKVYVFFSHTIKGQEHNMAMLKKLLELKCTLIDYEKIANDDGQRLVFFGHYAGLAGMIDSLWAVGKRLSSEGIENPFGKIKLAHEYHDLEEAKREISKVGDEIRTKGLTLHHLPSPQRGEGRVRGTSFSPIVPFVVGFAGYGHVAKGAWEIIDCLPVEEIAPADIIPPSPPLPATTRSAGREKGGLSVSPPLEKGGKGGFSDKLIYKVVFKEEHTVEPISKNAHFELQDYFSHPEKYKACFEKYLPYLTLLVNCIYWDKRYPRLVTKDYLKKLYSAKTLPKLKVIGDISCDVEGSIEATVKCTDPATPVFVYDVEKDKAVDWTSGFSRGTFPAKACPEQGRRAGHSIRGPAILAVDNLPCELPRESSAYFSKALEDFIPAIAKADYNVPFDKLALPPEIRRAVIVYRGELTPEFEYLREYVV